MEISNSRNTFDTLGILCEKHQKMNRKDQTRGGDIAIEKLLLW